ncbi:hypothetical protein [Bosea sp. TND4EK4]|uniref:hypothetical protein n=1 Tax=Bosea sp. TND4EK4 TaxID=1907408 RepID=UPI00095561FD|nr:hypothetical protein [Bosea sp. TND4EK4]SIP95157.1 hypothetical protein SAMN05880592_101302 [Bosea sp. TND4EK4]
MRITFAIAMVVWGALPVQAQQRHPMVSKVIEIAVAGRVVAAKCPGWTINPKVTALAAMAASFAGQQAALDAVREEEIQALTERAMKSSLTTPSECATLSGQTMPDPFSEGRTVALFVHAQQ